jgi:hypothetical protein
VRTFFPDSEIDRTRNQKLSDAAFYTWRFKRMFLITGDPCINTSIRAAVFVGFKKRFQPSYRI